MAEAPRSLLFVICGPSGVGKTTLLRELFARDPRLRFSVSMTTRTPRPGEVEGEDYHFVDEAAFDRAVAAGELLEHAVYNNHRYGTPRSEVERARRLGRDCVLEIDVQGAKQVRAAGVAACFIFIAPPDPAVLAERLRQRATETRQDFESRLATAQREMLERPWFEHCVVNDQLELAVHALQQIVRDERRGAK
ncbi:MAG: guanylate kinase [Fimbriimonadaceae bacterium]|nr:guanylate kinase [Fimbriimonadaceae bacterium]